VTASRLRHVDCRPVGPPSADATCSSSGILAGSFDIVVRILHVFSNNMLKKFPIFRGGRAISTRSMVDAAASTVFHSFFTSTSRIVLSKPSSSKITLDAVVKVVKREAIPRARAVVAVLARSNPDRAEEVPLDEQCRKWLVEYGSHHQLFATTHPLWCTGTWCTS
jgi:hypothetical protein